MKFLLIQILKGYKYFISPLLGNRCRFYPSCSEYMKIAIERFGVFKGIGLGIKRISRCHPGCEGGIDHVPNKIPEKKDNK
ncbi:MAG: membrane protein insertion efficiency factor YidD [Marinicellaceae bacterium]